MLHRQRHDGSGGQEGIKEGAQGPGVCGAQQVAPLLLRGQLQGLAMVLNRAAGKGHIEVVRALLMAGADLTKKNHGEPRRQDGPGLCQRAGSPGDHHVAPQGKHKRPSRVTKQ